MKGLKKAMVRCFGMRAHAHRRFHELVNRIPNNETIAATKLAAAAATATATATTKTTTTTTTTTTLIFQSACPPITLTIKLAAVQRIQRLHRHQKTILRAAFLLPIPRVKARLTVCHLL